VSGRIWPQGTSDVAAKVVTRTLLAALAVICLVPLLWLLLAPSKSESDLANHYPLSFGAVSGYLRAWSNLLSYQNGILLTWFANTVLYSAATVTLAIGTSVAAGYALATTRMPGRRILLLLSLVAMIVPGAALVLPIFVMLNSVHLVGTPLSVVLPLGFFPFGAYLSFIHFSTAIPRSLFEAARMDGASEWRIFTRIALPLSKSLVGLVAFFSFVGVWTNYFLPFVMLNDQNSYTLQLGLQTLLTSTAITNHATITNLPIQEPEGALAAIVTILPVAIVFMACQRYLARGILGGAVKD
jgi:multiple sugar transport system permease protein